MNPLREAAQAEKRKSEAMFLADELEAPLGTIIGAELQRRAAAELRRLHAERTAADGVINDLVERVRELQKENASLSAALAASCDEARDQMWESGGVSGCSRALSAEFQCAALLQILKHIEKEFRKHGRQYWPEAVMARKAIAAVEGKKT